MIQAVIFDYVGVTFKYLHLQADILELAKDLRAKGYKTALLSNMITPLAWLIKKQGAVRDLSPQIFSCDVKLKKPGPEIYQLMLKELGLPAEACLFADNRTDNVEAARALGMQGMVVRNPAKSVLEIRKQLGL